MMPLPIPHSLHSLHQTKPKPNPIPLKLNQPATAAPPATPVSRLTTSPLQVQPQQKEPSNELSNGRAEALWLHEVWLWCWGLACHAHSAAAAAASSFTFSLLLSGEGGAPQPCLELRGCQAPSHELRSSRCPMCSPLFKI
jgi:hypothetical protein